ncbi:E3 ubiquitin-protein ligase TRIM56-like [Saccostrea echinata]|uniref:E3 ubiquitin-protein ligase TRIM56-like n=1 Tax=Saccostrea echinata TaxID=191078 RepID=UPI002A8212C5|nr:E3 ubiquitin-protein ligase TRIM56-like [Saccostrea echinata]
MDSKATSQLDGHLKCSLCSDFFTDPKTLPCLHTFCKTCILSYMEQDRANKPSKCPVCFETFIKNLDDIKTNTFLQNMIHLLKTQTECTDLMCSFCKILGDIRPAVSQCLTCLDLLCEECATSRHTYTTITKDHKVVSLREIRTGQHNDEIRSSQCLENCHLHPNEGLRYFCITCKTAACSDCAIWEHKGHNTRLISDVRKEKEIVIKQLHNEMTLKLYTLEKNKDLIKSKQSKLSSLKTQIQNDITKKCSEAVSKIDRGRNKIRMQLENIMTPRTQSLKNGFEKISKECKNIKESLQFSELMQKGRDCEVVYLLDDIYERLQNLAKADSSDKCLLEDIPNLTIQITESQVELLENKSQSPLTSSKSDTCGKCIPKESDENTNLSDFVSHSSKAVQTAEEDFEITNKNIEVRVGRRKYKFNLLRILYLTETDDMFKTLKPIYSGIAWVDDNQFVAVDKVNAKIKMVSLSSGTILKSVVGYQPLAVSVWKDGISFLSVNNQMTSFSRDFVVQKTLSGISAVFASLPSLNQLMWTSNAVIYFQKNNFVT